VIGDKDYFFVIRGILNRLVSDDASLTYDNISHSHAAVGYLNKTYLEISFPDVSSLHIEADPGSRISKTRSFIAESNNHCAQP
jgi:hypothetical protein